MFYRIENSYFAQLTNRLINKEQLLIIIDHAFYSVQYSVIPRYTIGKFGHHRAQ